MKRTLTSHDYYMLCNKYQWFTHGTTEQYEKVFDFIDALGSDMTAKDIITISQLTWLCSDVEVNEIWKKIREYIHG